MAKCLTKKVKDGCVCIPLFNTDAASRHLSSVRSAGRHGSAVAHDDADMSGDDDIDTRPGDHGARGGQPWPGLEVSCSFLEDRDDINFILWREHKNGF